MFFINCQCFISLLIVWRTGNEGQLVIRDEDELSGNTENGWRKINTLADFNVSHKQRKQILAVNDSGEVQRLLENKPAFVTDIYILGN